MAREDAAMIEFTKGDMFKVPVDARVNTVNCAGVMGAGVALAFKKRYPEMFKDYEHACRAGSVRPGNLHIWKSLEGDWIINFPTKRDWQDRSRYEDIRSGLDALRTYLREQGPISVALPALGCGHGGLDWNLVSAMIKDKLGDLEARILVFEPQDSLDAGRAARLQSVEEEIRALSDLGFRATGPLPRRGREGWPPNVFAKGDQSLLSKCWIALLPSREPAEHEIAALGAVARQMASSARPIAMALVYSTRSTERIADLLLSHGIPVVLILPFGPLSRKRVARIPTSNQGAPMAMVAASAPSAPWGRACLRRSTQLLKENACGVLISDPDPDWLNVGNIRNWTNCPTYYLRYESLPHGMLQLLEHSGARAIGRRPGTGEPNLTALLDSPSSWKRGRAVSGAGSQPKGESSRARGESGRRPTAKERTATRTEIDRAAEFRQRLEHLVSRRRLPPSADRDVLLMGYWSLILDYHKGMQTLLMGGLTGSAFALVQPIVEALIRSHTVARASEGEIRETVVNARAASLRSVDPRIDDAFGPDGSFANFLHDAQAFLHTFTYPGAPQPGTHFAGDLPKPSYSQTGIPRAVRIATTAVFIVTRLVTQHLGFESEARAASALFDAWRNRSGG